MTDSESLPDGGEKLPTFQNQWWIIPNLDDRLRVGSAPIFDALARLAVSAHDPEFLTNATTQGIVIQSPMLPPPTGGTPR